MNVSIVGHLASEVEGSVFKRSAVTILCKWGTHSGIPECLGGSILLIGSRLLSLLFLLLALAVLC